MQDKRVVLLLHEVRLYIPHVLASLGNGLGLAQEGRWGSSHVLVEDFQGM